MTSIEGCSIMQVCSICLSEISDLHLFECSKCNQKCHKACSLYTEEEFRRYNIKECDTCRVAAEDQIKISKAKCVICIRKEGMLKIFNDNTKIQKWTHVGCIRWFMKKMTLNVDNGLIEFRSHKPLPDWIYISSCGVCKRTKKGDYFIQCQYEGCEYTSHSECIDRSLVGEIDSYERLKSVTFYCSEHINCRRTNETPDPYLKAYGNILSSKSLSDSEAKTKRVSLPQIIVERSEDVILSRFNALSKRPDTEDNETEEAIFSFVNTNFKCDICLKESPNTKMRKCRNCLTYSHPICLINIGEKDKSSICRKCSVDPEYIQTCMCCMRPTGTMLRLDKSWVHLLCALSFKKNFYKKQDKCHTLGVKYDTCLLTNTCRLCMRSNLFTVKCKSCNLVYHPYCGFTFNFDVILNENNQTSDDILSKYEVDFSCRGHSFYNDFENRLKFVKKINDEINLNSPKNDDVTFMGNNPHKLPCLSIKKFKDKNIQIKSFDYQKLKSMLKMIKKFNIYTSYDDWSWDNTENYFIDITSDYLEVNKNYNLKLKSKNYSVQSEKDNFEFDSSKIICRVSSGKNEYLVIYDTSRIERMKLNPDFMSYSNILNKTGETENFKFINKRRRSYIDDKTDTNLPSYSLIMKNIKIIEDEEETSKSQTVTKLKFSFDGKRGDTETEDKILLTKPETDEPRLERSFLRKIKLLSFYKLNKRDRLILDLEDAALRKPKHGKGFYDIDKEINLKYHMYNSILRRNISSLESLKCLAPPDCNSDYDLQILNTFREVRKHSNIVRRLIKGVHDKSIESLLYTRGQNYKLEGEADSQGNVEEYYRRLINGETECCVCFHCDEDSPTIVFCDKCNVSVHEECYGISEIPEGEYFCDRCSEPDVNQDIECLLCRRTGGAMKRIKNKRIWVHVTCTLVSEDCKVSSYSKMEVESLAGEHDAINSQHCDICKKGGGLIQSYSGDYNSDKVYFHFLCAYLEGLQVKIKKELIKGQNYFYKLTPVIEIENYSSREMQRALRRQIYQNER